MKKKKSLKVLFTSHTANFHKFNRPFMRLLKDMGYEVHYASAGEEKILDADKSFTVDFPRNPFRIDKLVKSYRQLKKVLNDNYYEIIHTHTPVGSIITRLAARKTRKNGTRVIYTNHGAHFVKGGSIVGWILWYPIEKIFAHMTDTIVTINSEDYERMKKHFKTDVRYLNGGVGVDLTRFNSNRMTRKQRDAKRKEMGLKPDDFVIIYVAELSRRKNHKMILSATPSLVAEIPNLQLLFPGKDSLSGENQRLAKKLSIDKRTHFLGYRQDIPDLYNIADLAIAISKREGLGLHLVEAMASGLPVIGTKIRGHTEILNDSEMFALEDTEGMKSKIKSAKAGKIKSRSVSKKFLIQNAQSFHKELYNEKK